MTNKLSELVDKTPSISRHCPREVSVSGIETDSRDIKPGYIFFALSGEQTDGNRFISKSIQNGAVAIVSERPYEENKSQLHADSSYIQVEDIHRGLAEISAQYYGTYHLPLTVIGITGTNGKTTIATLIHKALRRLGRKTLFIGTTGFELNDEVIPTDFTTPPANKLHELLNRAAGCGVEFVIMEVSSHALKLKRVWGLRFDGAVFTNLTHEHREIHPTMDDYLASKRALFDMVKPGGFAIVNTDDSYGKQIFQHVRENNAQLMQNGQILLIDYGRNAQTLKLTGMETDIAEGLQRVHFSQVDRPMSLSTSMLGEHNAYNALAAYGVLFQLGFKPGEIQMFFPSLPGVEGRFEWHRISDFNVLIDFAHTPDGLEKILKAIGELNKGVGKVITVFGCPGSRDPSKRPLMGGIAGRLSDWVIVTTDDIHYEEPEAIIRDIVRGIDQSHFETIVSRREAIAAGLQRARTGDWLLIAGRGHEKFQYVRDQKIPFLDKTVVMEEAEKMGLQ